MTQSKCRNPDQGFVNPYHSILQIPSISRPFYQEVRSSVPFQYDIASLDPILKWRQGKDPTRQVKSQTLFLSRDTASMEVVYF